MSDKKKKKKKKTPSIGCESVWMTTMENWICLLVSFVFSTRSRRYGCVLKTEVRLRVYVFIGLGLFRN